MRSLSATARANIILRVQHRRALTWLWRAWASTPLVIAIGSLLIGYLRSSSAPDLPGTRDSLEALVGLGFSALVCLPLVIGAGYLDQRSSATANPARVRRLVWLLLALVPPLGGWMFLYYLFGELGMSIRGRVMALVEPR